MCFVPFFIFVLANKRDYVLLNNRYTELTCFANNKHVLQNLLFYSFGYFLCFEMK